MIGGEVGFLSYDQVEERLVEAVCLWRKAPDRERGWLKVRACWPDIRRAEFIRIIGNELDWPEEKPEARPLPLSRLQVAEMEEAGDWLRFVAERDRKLVVLALSYKASGKRPPWERIWNGLGRGKPGPEGLQMRYRKAIATICQQVNGAGNCEGGVSR